MALVGNPNLGKSTLFNALCGLKQKTGNYPGVTVDKKTGKISDISEQVELIDLPGINSLYPKSKDEELVVDYLLSSNTDTFPDKLIVMASAINLKRSLFVVDQIRDLNIPMILVINMSLLAERRGIFIDASAISKELGVPVILVEAKTKHGLTKLKELIVGEIEIQPRKVHYVSDENNSAAIPNKSAYVDFLSLVNDPENKKAVDQRSLRTNEAILRYKFINQLLEKTVKVDKSKAVDLTTKADKILVHPIWGYVIFGVIMFSIFQSIFLIAAYPMDWIDQGFASLSTWAQSMLPEGYLTELICQGIIPGVGGVVIFIPQIAILFFLFGLLEQSGYMQRIVFLMDRFMQHFGMSGKSIVPMISGMACAIPAIMAARSIENKKERLITILITPLMTCSARIPVYIILIAIIIPDGTFVGIFHAQGLVLMVMYLLGVVMTLIVAIVLKWIMKTDYKSLLIADMPEYLKPQLSTLLINVWTNVRSFLWNAGKIILAASIVLFVLATNGGDNFKKAEANIESHYGANSAAEKEELIAAYELENSYLGMMGRSIEPAIAPLGYDWKIGIAIISSLAAREVFVGTMSTIYAINSTEEMTIRDRLRNETDGNGAAIFTLATCVSLLVFYAFALQCFSTIVITYRETKSFKWTAIQFFYMTALAYFAALIAYQLLK